MCRPLVLGFPLLRQALFPLSVPGFDIVMSSVSGPALSRAFVYIDADSGSGSARIDED